jgi:DNA-binding NtrC family response regulator
MTALQAYPWPGNVRELVNVIERAVSFADGEVLALAELPDYVRTTRPHAPRAQTSPTGHRRVSPAGITGNQPIVPMSASAPTPTPPEELLAEGVTFKDAKERWVAAFERDYILQLLRRNNGNISHAARAADIDRKYFRKLMKKYDIEAAGVDDDAEAE